MHFECDMMLNSGDSMDYATSTASSIASIRNQQQQNNDKKLLNSDSLPLYNEFNNNNLNTFDRIMNNNNNNNNSQHSRSNTILNSRSSTNSLNDKDTNDEDGDVSDDSIDCETSMNLNASNFMLNQQAQAKGSFLQSINNGYNKDFDAKSTASGLIGNGDFLNDRNSNYNQDFLNSVNKFQYILMSPTSPAVKTNEDTLTYLNQGQSYELKFNRIDLNKPVFTNSSYASASRQNSLNIKKCNDDDENDFKDFYKLDPSTSTNEDDNSCMYLSTVRLCFWDRKLQEIEHDEIREWEKEYHPLRMLEVDNNLSFGAYDVRVSNVYTNAIEVIWNGKLGSSIFVKCNCTSTAFAKNKHGGEKGVHMRLQIDTFQITNPSIILGPKLKQTQDQTDNEKQHQNEVTPKLAQDLFSEQNDWWKHLCSSYCRIQLFRLKGAQRKLKTDRLKIERSNPPDLKRRYQTSEAITVMYNCAFDSLYSMLPLDRNELIQRQKAQQKLEIFDPAYDSPLKTTSHPQYNSNNNNTQPSLFYCENDLNNNQSSTNNNNNNAINESIQFYVENSSFSLSESSKFGLLVDDISAIIDETPDGDNLFASLNSLPSSRRNSILSCLLPSKQPKIEPDTAEQNVYSSSKISFPTTISLPHDLSAAVSSRLQMDSKKDLYSTQNQQQLSQITDNNRIAAIKNTTTMPTTKNLLQNSAQNTALINDATADYVQQWLTANRFSHLLPIFKNYTSNDFLRLSKDDLIKLCGPPDAIRCFNLAHNIQVCPRLTMYVKLKQQNYFYAIYLNECKCKYLIKRLIQFQSAQQQQQSVDTTNSNNNSTTTSTTLQLDTLDYHLDVVNNTNCEFFMKSKGIIIKMTDEVLNNLRDETKFLVEFITKEQECENGGDCEMKMKSSDSQQQSQLLNTTIIAITLVPLD